MEVLEAWEVMEDWVDWALVDVAMEEVSEATEAMVGVGMVGMGLEASEYLEDMGLDLLGLLEGGREVVTRYLPDYFLVKLLIH